MVAQQRTGNPHWHKHTSADGICWLSLDKRDSSTNILSSDILRELDLELSALAAHPPAGLVVKSAKESGFIAGADISEFERLENAQQAAALATGAQALFSRLAELPCPTVAAMNGFALGGGLELALACDYRVAVESYERCLGLPEVQLGIHPGFGGTVRTVQLLGPLLALDLMLTGRSISPMEAKQMGLVDRTSKSDKLDAAARELIEGRPPKRKAPLHLRLLNLGLVRPWLAGRIAARLQRRAPREHYPAPYAVLELWRRHGARGTEAYAAEAQSIGELLLSATSKNLVRVFFLRERLRGLAPKHSSVQRVHVVGAGVMGGDIASWCALSGLTVTLQDRAREYVEPALDRAEALFHRRLKAPGAAEAARRRLRMDLEASEVGAADVIIEAIIERLAAKRSVFEQLEPKIRDDAILATNTSSIKLEELATVLEHPARFVGIHFFNPVAKLPLVEVIRSATTDEAVLQRTLSFVTQIGKLPLPCVSAPGFVVNRILAPYMLEAMRAHEDGYAFETIDKAAENFGMPMGPVELADRVGLDVALHVTEILGELLGTERPQLLQAKVDAGQLGAKTGMGFYQYEKDRPKKSRNHVAPDALLQDRLILALVNEAMACYEDGVVEDLDLIDAGVIFGTGFAPFTGGPINYVRERGVASVVHRLGELAERFGPRFTPRPGWQELISES